MTSTTTNNDDNHHNNSSLAKDEQIWHSEDTCQSEGENIVFLV